MVEQFERNKSYFLQEDYASDSPFGQEAYIGIVDDDDTHVPTAIEFKAMIDDLQRLNALVKQHFDEKMAAQVEAESKQLKFLVEKTKSMSKYAQVMIDVVHKQAKTTSKRAKVVATKQEEQSQSQGTIMKAISKMVGQ